MLNNISITGRLTQTPELRHTPGNVAVTDFTLAVERDYKNAAGERETDFIDIVAWRGTAEFACTYFNKGQLMTVTGSIQTRKYEDNDGNKRKAIEIVANNVYFGDSKKPDTGVSEPSNASSNSLDTVDDDDIPPAPFDPFA